MSVVIALTQSVQHKSSALILLIYGVYMYTCLSSFKKSSLIFWCSGDVLHIFRVCLCIWFYIL